MSSFPFIALFSSSLFLSTLMIISSSHWLMMWMALEINMISFLPLISGSNWFQEAEAAMKYFMFQALGSSFILMAASFDLLNIALLLGTAIKLGMAPFHFWFPSVMNSLNWPTCILLSTWQKLGPLMIMTNACAKSLLPLTLSLAALSALTGGLGGLSQTQMRSLMAYSSIGHMGWILSATTISNSLAISYFMLYCMITIPLFVMFWQLNLFSNSLHNKLSHLSPLIITMTVLLLLSLGGLPPLTGFIPKWLVLSSLQVWPLIGALLLGSAMNLFFYLNICLSMSSTIQMNKMSAFKYPSITISIMFILATSLLPISSFLMYALILFY